MAAKTSPQHNFPSRTRWIQRVKIDQLRRSIISRSATVVALRRRTTGARTLGPDDTDRRKSYVSRNRLTRPHRHVTHQRVESGFNHLHVVATRWQVKNLIRPINGVDGVGDPA